jgi:NADH-quinone oxidoreductase subunit C
MEPRFEVIYLLHSMERRSERLRLKCRLHGDNPEIDSITGVWAGANWYERETFDLFGIVFRNHPNLTRIMMPDEWIGHPLRKDFPVHGHRYSYQDE